jgi:hypothetical protein
MTTITGAVGAHSPNRAADVAAVQQLLNQRIADFDMTPLRTDGVCDSETIRAIRDFQIRVLHVHGDGRVDPGGATLGALDDSSPASLQRQRTSAIEAKARLSGADWFNRNQANYPNSALVSDLAPAFSAQVNAFLGALRLAGATVSISATRRNKTRAWLMHYSWQIAKGAVAAADVPADADTDIIWDHGDTRRSRAAAQEMVDLFHIAFKPSLTSNHIRGTAIDMTISWDDTIAVVDARGKTHTLGQPRSGANTSLQAIGASYGVHKLLSDPPHWSANGH